MAISWKKKFKPDLILKKVDKARLVSSDGRVSFSGFDLHEHMPVLSSMLLFPDAAERLNKSSLIWSALAQAKTTINSASFLEAINASLKKELSTQIQPYVLVTSLSISRKGMPASLKVLDASIEFLARGVPRNFAEHRGNAKKHKLPILETPASYLQVRVKLRDKSPQAAAQQGIDRIDFLRGILALHVNLAMQVTFGGSATYEPINRVRCGGVHTIHKPNGEMAVDAVWFEPNFRPAKIHTFKNSDNLFRIVKVSLARIQSCPYRKKLISALVRSARAMDEPDSNTAFVKLWSALESLMTPDQADYDKFVRRTAFLYTDTDYHRQILEHLREYRNASVHSGIEADDARTNCFILQEYFRTAVHFYIANARIFASLEEAHEFLDLPPGRDALQGKLRLLRKALAFVGPQAET